MGFFSWKTQDTNETIWNIYSGHIPPTVVMTDDKNNNWIEKWYEGYGVFGGKDFFVLMAEMNGLTEEVFKDIRSEAIDLMHSPRSAWSEELQEHMKNRDILYPNLTEYSQNWENKPPEDCPTQGYFSEFED